MLVDSVEITLRSGKGGDGIVSWRREKFVPKGGPDGGDGGRGGSVILRSSHNLDTLSSFRYRKVFQADNGQNGQNKRKAGRAAADLELLIPVGTIVTNLKDGQVIMDFQRSDQQLVIARGGRGGLGNIHFATSTNQAPTEFTAGKPGQVLEVKLELQLIADVALIGLPNAGKSSLIQELTGVEARIGDYAFSTTEPLLGVMRHNDRAITIIDLPGLIEGAHRGRGLGDKFLQHARRVRAIIHVIDATDADLKQSEQAIATELAAFDDQLAALPRQIVISKIDLLDPKELKAIAKAFPEAILVSAKDKTNLDQLAARVYQLTT